jgi:hypothetical protein
MYNIIEGRRKTELNIMQETHEVVIERNLEKWGCLGREENESCNIRALLGK